MKCEYCDNQMPRGVSRCPYCGGPVAAQDEIGSEIERNQGLCVPNTPSETKRFAQNNFDRNPGKNKLAYILLGVFLGEFGIHNFYTGYIARGVIKLLITFLSFGTLFWISWVWSLVEICTVRIDARGYPFEI